MTAPLRTREAYRLHLADSEGVQVTGHPDGICLRFGGEVIEVFPALIGAMRGQLTATEALVMLSNCLRRA